MDEFLLSLLKMVQGSAPVTGSLLAVALVAWKISSSRQRNVTQSECDSHHKDVASDIAELKTDLKDVSKTVASVSASLARIEGKLSLYRDDNPPR